MTSRLPSWTGEWCVWPTPTVRIPSCGDRASGSLPGSESSNACLAPRFAPVCPAQPPCWTGERSFRPPPAFSLVDGSFCGAGGNRTPVHQPVNELATTIPGVATDAVTPTGRLSARGGPRSVFPVSQRSFSPSAVFPAVIPHFCCRAVMDWPRATFLLTMTLHSPGIRRRERTAHRQFFWFPRLASLRNSGRKLEQRY